MEKLEWCGYVTMQIFWRYVYSFWQNTRTWQTDTAWWHRPRLHSIAWQELPMYQLVMHKVSVAFFQVNLDYLFVSNLRILLGQAKTFHILTDTIPPSVPASVSFHPPPCVAMLDSSSHSKWLNYLNPPFNIQAMIIIYNDCRRFCPFVCFYFV